MSTPRKPLGEAEFNQLFHTYHKPVFLYLRTLLARRGHPPDPHLVEDLTQEAFTILWEKQESFLASPNPIGWLYVTAANLARNHLRTQQRWAACLAQVDPEFLEAQPDPRPLEAGLLNLEGVVAPEELDLLRRVYLEGYSYEELAQELGTKPNTLASRVSRIKAKFRKNFPESEKFFPESEKFLQDGCKESRPPGHKEGRGGSEP